MFGKVAHRVHHWSGAIEAPAKESDMHSITQQRDPILDHLEGSGSPDSTGWWAGVLIVLLAMLVISSAFRPGDNRSEAGPSQGDVSAEVAGP